MPITDEVLTRPLECYSIIGYLDFVVCCTEMLQ